MRARFIGRSSMGFETGKIYNIKTDCKIVAKNRGKFGFSDPFPCLCVYDIYSDAWCPYSRLETFLKNWELL